MMHDDNFYPPYVPVAERRAKAERKLLQLRKQQPHITPVIIAGKSLATTWWGKSWNSNLERYADYNNRIGRGRSYVRHHAVLDLQLASGKITALVQGSRPQPYTIAITIGTLSADNWRSIRQACEGHFDSLSELLAGKFPQALKDLFFEKGTGLFPAPRDIHFDCSCPDWASMCKHIAAALYGVGARLDEDPALFFTLRGINIDDLITQTLTDTAHTLLGKAERQSQHILQDVDLGDVFGIQLDDVAVSSPQLPAVQPTTSTAQKPIGTARKTTASKQITPATRKTATKPRVMPPPPVAGARTTARGSVLTTRTVTKPTGLGASRLPYGTTLETLVKAVGIARKGKSIDQLQAKLGWTRVQVRNTVRRADAKGLIEAVAADVYRRKV
jgi:uncharacterized Zn finger protein